MGVILDWIANNREKWELGGGRERIRPSSGIHRWEIGDPLTFEIRVYDKGKVEIIHYPDSKHEASHDWEKRTILFEEDSKLVARYYLRDPRDGDKRWLIQIEKELAQAEEDEKTKKQTVFFQRNNDLELDNPKKFREATPEEVEELRDGLPVDCDRNFVTDMLNVKTDTRRLNFEETLWLINQVVSLVDLDLEEYKILALAALSRLEGRIVAFEGAY